MWGADAVSYVWNPDSNDGLGFALVLCACVFLFVCFFITMFLLLPGKSQKSVVLVTEHGQNAAAFPPSRRGQMCAVADRSVRGMAGGRRVASHSQLMAIITVCKQSCV